MDRPVDAIPMTDPSVAIAVLYERVGHVIEKVDALTEKIDAQDRKRTAALDELETRVEHIEKTVSGFRWFIAGIAASGGALGGGIAAVIAKALGG